MLHWEKCYRGRNVTGRNVTGRIVTGRIVLGRNVIHPAKIHKMKLLVILLFNKDVLRFLATTVSICLLFTCTHAMWNCSTLFGSERKSFRLWSYDRFLCKQFFSKEFSISHFLVFPQDFPQGRDTSIKRMLLHLSLPQFYYQPFRWNLHF